MVEIYTSPSCSSCRKAKKWLDEYGIKYIEKNLFVTKITREDIKQILEKTENNFLSVLKMAEYHIFMQAGNLCIDSDFIYMYFNYILTK